MCDTCSEKLKSIQLVLGEYNMYNDREEFSEQKYKLKRKIVHPKVKEECVQLTTYYDVCDPSLVTSSRRCPWRMTWRCWSSAHPLRSRRTSFPSVCTERNNC